MKLYCVDFRKKELEFVFDDQELIYSSKMRKSLKLLDKNFQAAIDIIYNITNDKDFTQDCGAVLGDILVKLNEKKP